MAETWTERSHALSPAARVAVAQSKLSLRCGLIEQSDKQIGVSAGQLLAAALHDFRGGGQHFTPIGARLNVAAGILAKGGNHPASHATRRQQVAETSDNAAGVWPGAEAR